MYLFPRKDYTMTTQDYYSNLGVLLEMKAMYHQELHTVMLTKGLKADGMKGQ